MTFIAKTSLWRRTKNSRAGFLLGTLNPALQDRFGRPKKDISTIIHILNDLLCAEPRVQCKSSCNCASSLEKMEAALNDDSHPISIVSSDSVFENGGVSAVLDPSNSFPLSSGSCDGEYPKTSAALGEVLVNVCPLHPWYLARAKTGV